MDAMVTTGEVVSRVVVSMNAGRPVGPGATGVSATRETSYRLMKKSG
jgi:hypothetical protein